MNEGRARTIASRLADFIKILHSRFVLIVSGNSLDEPTPWLGKRHKWNIAFHYILFRNRHGVLKR